MSRLTYGFESHESFYLKDRRFGCLDFLYIVMALSRTNLAFRKTGILEEWYCTICNEKASS